MASVAPNIGGGRHVQLELKMAAEDYLTQTCHMFFPLHNLDGKMPKTGNTKEQKLRKGIFRKNQALFRRYIVIDRAIKEQPITLVEPVLISPIKDQQTGFGQVMAMKIMENLFRAYGEIFEIELKEDAVKMMEDYHPE